MNALSKSSSNAEKNPSYQNWLKWRNLLSSVSCNWPMTFLYGRLLQTRKFLPPPKKKEEKKQLCSEWRVYLGYYSQVCASQLATGPWLNHLTNLDFSSSSENEELAPDDLWVPDHKSMIWCV